MSQKYGRHLFDIVTFLNYFRGESKGTFINEVMQGGGRAKPDTRTQDKEHKIMTEWLGGQKMSKFA